MRDRFFCAGRQNGKSITTLNKWLEYVNAPYRINYNYDVIMKDENGEWVVMDNFKEDIDTINEI